MRLMILPLAAALTLEQSLLAISLALVLLMFVFLPTIIAASREHENLLAIFALNLFLGWTFLGWIIALVWACMAQRRRDGDRVIHQHVHYQSQPQENQGISIRLDMIPEQREAETDTQYAERMKRLRDMSVLPPAQR